MTELIRNRKHLAQVVSFVGLEFGSISPTDIDAFIDFGGKMFVFIEAKRTPACLDQVGQRLAFERSCDVCQMAGVESLFIVAQHDVPEPGVIVLAPLPVLEFRLRGKWRLPKEPSSVRQIIDKFRGWRR